MKEIFGQIKDYLPKFLSPDQKEKLFAQLDDFPKNIDQRVYTTALADDPGLFQGDGISDVWVVNLPSENVARGRCLVISNTCDIAIENKTSLPLRVSYCPIVSLAKLESLLTETASAAYAQSFLRDVRLQRITSMFYLPKGGGLEEDGAALLNHTLNCALNKEEHEHLKTHRLFTLSNYGFYLFLFKVSIHFTRIMDGVDRDVAA